jgi:hypothetical protein
MVIVLHREFSAGSIGITLAGGADYESKEITVSVFLVQEWRNKTQAYYQGGVCSSWQRG